MFALTKVRICGILVASTISCVPAPSATASVNCGGYGYETCAAMVETAKTAAGLESVASAQVHMVEQTESYEMASVSLVEQSGAEITIALWRPGSEGAFLVGFPDTP